MDPQVLLIEALDREKSYLMQIKILREEKELLEAEKNMYRSQALMRANQIELLNNQLQQAYE